MEASRPTLVEKAVLPVMQTTRYNALEVDYALYDDFFVTILNGGSQAESAARGGLEHHRGCWSRGDAAFCGWEAVFLRPHRQDKIVEGKVLLVSLK